MADDLDSKSTGRKAWGFDSPSGHHPERAISQIDAAKDFFFGLPATSRDPRIREEARNCKAALRSRLIFAGVLSEECVSTATGKKRYSQYMTLYAIFRKPKANECFVGILGVERRRAKNLA